MDGSRTVQVESRSSRPTCADISPATVSVHLDHDHGELPQAVCIILLTVPMALDFDIEGLLRMM